VKDRAIARALGSKLRHLREKAGLTQAQLATSTGMHTLGIAKIERGEWTPGWDTVHALCKALGVRCTAFEGVVEATALEPKRGRGRPRKAAAEAIELPAP
jgi:transcriptional regulator with XRE-family HTH domain